MADDLGVAVAVRVVLRCGHEPFRVVAVIQHPVIHSAAGNAVVVVVGSREQQHGCHGAAKAEALNANLVRLDIRQRLQPLCPFHKITYLDGIQVFIDGVQALAAVVPGGAAIGNKLDDAVLPIPFVTGGAYPAVTHHRGVRAAVNVNVNRVLFGRIKILGIVNHSGKFQAINRYGNYLARRAFLRGRAAYNVLVGRLASFINCQLWSGCQI